MHAVFTIEDGNLVMKIVHPDGVSFHTRSLGIWLEGDCEGALRLFARAFTAGQQAKCREIAGVLNTP